MIAVIKRST